MIMISNRQAQVLKLASGTVVAIEGWVGNWAAYRGCPGDSAEDVAYHGDKLSYEEAAQVFPVWDKRLTWSEGEDGRG